jgi:hypothetical protein
MNLNDLQEINEDQSYTCASSPAILKIKYICKSVFYHSEGIENSIHDEEQ